jgi:alpha-galactosidase
MRLYHHNLTILPPEACLHWAWSDTRTGENGAKAFPGFTPWDTKNEPWQLDTHIRIGMLGAYGFSHKFKLFDEGLKDVFKRHISFYKMYVKEFIRCGVVSKLVPVEYVDKIDLYSVQYSIKEQNRALVFVFAKDEQPVSLKLKELRPETVYTVKIVDSNSIICLSGGELMQNGIELGLLRSWESRALLIESK